ncbi:MAG: hypothetical protein RL748_454 [Pseudomonadota bacterium]|jgi:hypothetical protein
MGWWNAPEDPNLVIGDTVLDSVRHFLNEFSREYQVDLSRKPTLQELEYVLNLACRINADNEILDNFDEIEIKQVVIKTAKRAKRQKTKPGDIFSFKLDDGRFGFGRIVSVISIGAVAEIFDYFANQPVFDYSRLGHWLISPVPIDSFSLLERGKEGDWRIIGQTSNFIPGPEFEAIRFVYGRNVDSQTVVNINDHEAPISAEDASKLPRYSPLGDMGIKKLVDEHLVGYSKKE